MSKVLAALRRRRKALLAAAAVFVLLSLVAWQTCFVRSYVHAASLGSVQTCEGVVGFDADRYPCGFVLYSLRCCWELRDDPHARWSL